MLRPPVVLLVGLALTGCFSPSSDPLPEDGSDTGGCPVGSETCACTQAGTCDPGLECRSGLCVAEEDSVDGSSGGGTSSGSETSTSADGTTSGSSSDDGSSSSSGGDACGGLCTGDQQCVEGQCVLSCGAGEIACDGVCIDPAIDMDHCGAVGDCLGANAGVACDPTPIGACPGALGESCQAGSCATACPSGMQSFGVSGIVEDFALPACVAEIHVVAAGAQGGTSLNGSAGGMGAMVEGDLCVTPGTTLSIVVGEQPIGASYPNGGGGGSYVVDGMTPLLVAGGGGGGYSNWAPGGAATMLTAGGPGVGGTSHNDGGGGGGFTTDGAGTMGSGGSSFLNGSAGGVDYPLDDPETGRGGFGGGGGSSESGTFNAGGGGGYDGGNSGNGNASTGGTSYLDPTVTNSAFTPAIRAGHGSVEISW